MHALHEWLAILALAVAVVCLGLAAAWWLSGRSERVLLDRLILAQSAGLLMSVATGVVLAIAQGLPRDPLHLLYAVLVLVPLPLARYLGRTGSYRRRAGYLALGAFVTAGLVVRLFQTGV